MSVSGAPLLALKANAAPGPASIPIRWRLANGMRAVFLREPGAGLVAAQMVYAAGSKFESVGTRGVARLVEALMFEGSERVAPGAHYRLLHQVGGTAGSLLTEDVALFHQVAPPEALDLMLELEADRQRGLALLPSAIRKHRARTLDRREQILTREPATRAVELFRAAAFEQHPYAWGPSGNKRDLELLQERHVRAFYESRYAADQAAVVITGDAREDVVRAAVERHFGGEAPKTTAGSSPAVAPPFPYAPPGAAVEQHLVVPVPAPVAVVGYHLPAAGHRDGVALSVLAHVLAGRGAHSELQARVASESEDVVALGGAARSLAHGGLMVFFAVCRQGADAKSVARLLGRNIADVVQAASKSVWSRGAESYASALASDRQTLLGRSVQSALSDALGAGWQSPAVIAQAAGVTRDHIHNAAKEHLRASNLVVLTANPEGT